MVSFHLNDKPVMR